MAVPVVNVKADWAIVENGNTATTVLTVTTATQREGDADDRAFMDLVLVVDTSGSMNKEGKLQKVRDTLKGILTGKWPATVGNKKEEPWIRDLDKLCIITFDEKVDVPFPLYTMSKQNREKALEAVDNLRAGRKTNIQAGLERGVQVINGRPGREDRAAAIILLSDGFENMGKAREVDVKAVHVDTIGFGTKHDQDLLTAISRNSDGGAYSNAWDHRTLIQTLSPPLDFIKHIVAKNLELTLEQAPTMRVVSGTYRQETVVQHGIKKFCIASVQGGSPHRITVRFYLPPPQREDDTETVMTFHWKCRRLIRTADDEASPQGGFPIKIKRTQAAGPRQRALIVNDVVPKVVRTEETRLNHLEMIKQVRKLADEGKFDEAQETLAVGMTKLDDLQFLTNSDVSKKAINYMYAEVEELFKVVESQDKYKNRGGQCYVAACISSHERQRYVARGDAACRVRLFITDRMNDYLNDAIKLDNMARNA